MNGTPSRSSFFSRSALGAVLVGTSIFAAFACSSSDDNQDNDGGAGGEAPSTGGAPSGGAPSGGAPSGGAPAGGAPSGGAPSGGAPTGGVGGEGGEGGTEKLFESLLYVDSRSSSDERLISASAQFYEPDFDARLGAEHLVSEWATLVSLDNGECGLAASPEDITIPAIEWAAPRFEDDGDVLLDFDMYDSDIYWGDEIDTTGGDSNALRDFALDYVVAATDDAPEFVAEDAFVIPSVPDPNDRTCLATSGCTIDAQIDADELLLEFQVEDSTYFCRGASDGSEVTIPADLLEHDTSARLHHFRHATVYWGGSPVTVLIQAYGDTFGLSTTTN